jgi:uncharacterized membrane protein HdeD (DUF308 family)
MEQTILGIIMLFAGTGSIIFRRRLALFHADTQKQTANIHLSAKQNKKHELTIVACGLIVFVLGILTLLGITKWHG